MPLLLPQSLTAMRLEAGVNLHFCIISVALNLLAGEDDLNVA